MKTQGVPGFFLWLEHFPWRCGNGTRLFGGRCLMQGPLLVDRDNGRSEEEPQTHVWYRALEIEIYEHRPRIYHGSSCAFYFAFWMNVSSNEWTLQSSLKNSIVTTNCHLLEGSYYFVGGYLLPGANDTQYSERSMTSPPTCKSVRFDSLSKTLRINPIITINACKRLYRLYTIHNSSESTKGASSQ